MFALNDSSRNSDEKMVSSLDKYRKIVIYFSIFKQNLYAILIFCGILIIGSFFENNPLLSNFKQPLLPK